MEKLHAPSSGRSPTIAPLARDPDGRAIRIPDGVVGWRIRRHTGGRPRLVLGEGKQPMQFPLEYTLADVEEILPPGTYRLDAIDEQGSSAVTVPITIPGPRNGTAWAEEASGDEEAAAEVSTVLPVSGSDVRLVLEANVRATQMAFVHNERTLAIGMRMAETLREGVQVLTEAQSDWIKTLATSRGFFRNAPLVQLPAPAAPSRNRKDDEEDEDEEDEEDEEDDDDQDEEDEAPAAPPASWMEALMPAIAPLVKEFGPMLVDMLKHSGASGSKFDLRDFLHWGHSKKKKARAAAADAQQAAATEASPATPNPPAEAEQPSGPAQAPASLGEMLRMLPPEIVPKLVAARAQLTPSEQSRMMKLLSVMPPEDLKAVAGGLAIMSTDEIVAFVRTELAKQKPTAPAPAPAVTTTGEE